MIKYSTNRIIMRYSILKFKRLKCFIFITGKMKFILLTSFCVLPMMSVLLLIAAYAELIKSIWKQESGDSVSPMAFKTQIQRFAPRFVGYR